MSANRRQFLLATGMVSLGATLPEMAAAQPENPPRERDAALLKAQTEIARQRFGKFLTEEHLQAVQQALRSDQASAAALRAVRLDNSDEPDFTFTAAVE